MIIINHICNEDSFHIGPLACVLNQGHQCPQAISAEKLLNLVWEDGYSIR